jgi:hypothetical protein
MDRTFLCIWVYGEGERPEPTKSVDATIEGDPIELTDDRKSGRCTFKIKSEDDSNSQTFFQALDQNHAQDFPCPLMR